MTGPSALSLACVLLIAGSAQGLAPRYTWKAGEVQRFRYEETRTFDLLGPIAMPLSQPRPRLVLRIVTVFTERVLSVAPDGTADMQVTLRRFDVSEDGRKVATLRQIHRSLRQFRGQVDLLGRARFDRGLTFGIDPADDYLRNREQNRSARSGPRVRFRLALLRPSAAPMEPLGLMALPDDLVPGAPRRTRPQDASIDIEHGRTATIRTRIVHQPSDPERWDWTDCRADTLDDAERWKDGRISLRFDLRAGKVINAQEEIRTTESEKDMTVLISKMKSRLTRL